MTCNVIYFTPFRYFAYFGEMEADHAGLAWLVGFGDWTCSSLNGVDEFGHALRRESWMGGS